MIPVSDETETVTPQRCTLNMLIAALQGSLLDHPHLGDKPVIAMIQNTDFAAHINYVAELKAIRKDGGSDVRCTIIGLDTSGEVVL